jgi:hypothetical protein
MGEESASKVGLARIRCEGQMHVEFEVVGDNRLRMKAHCLVAAGQNATMALTARAIQGAVS